MTSPPGERTRASDRPVTLAELTAQAVAALQAAGLEFESLELDAGFRRKPRHDTYGRWPIPGSAKTESPG